MRAALLAVLLLGSPVSAQGQKPEPKYEGKPLAYWVERFQKAENHEDRNAAARAIGAFGSDGAPAVPALLVMLNDHSPSYRATVAKILCDIGPGAKAAVPDLINRLKDKYATKPREEKQFELVGEIRELLEVLGAIGEDAKDAVPAIVMILEKPGHDTAVIQALCRIGPAAKEAIPAIRRAILDGLSPKSERWVRGAIGDLHRLGSEAAPLLIELLGAPEKEVRADAFQGLNELPTTAIKGSPQLAKWMAKGDAVTRYYAAALAWKVEKNKAAIPVLASLTNDLTPFNDSERSLKYNDVVAGRAIALLQKIGPDAKGALPALRQAVVRGFVMWYFVESRYERYGDLVSIPSVGPSSDSFASYQMVALQVALGDTARDAIAAIESPQAPNKDVDPR
jgi:HEAT repeat protein